MPRPISELTPFILGLFEDTREALYETASNVKIRMSETGKPVEYPVQWDSEKQRKFVMAKLRRENNLPYRRTGAYERSYIVERQPFGVTLHAPHPAGAIGGIASGWQSRIHRGRWNYLLQILSDELNKLPDLIRNKFEVRSGK